MNDAAGPAKFQNELVNAMSQLANIDDQPARASDSTKVKNG